MGIRTPSFFVGGGLCIRGREFLRVPTYCCAWRLAQHTHAKEGDFVYLRSASPIAVNGQIIVPVGSYVQGVVAETKRSGVLVGEPNWRFVWRR